MSNIHSVITGTGSYIPSIIKTNRDFTTHNFYDEDNKRIDTDPQIVVNKFEQITGIVERRYATSLGRVDHARKVQIVLTST